MVHQYKFDGQGVVLDTCSGAVHLVDDVAYDIIALWPEHTPEEIEREVLGRYGGRPDVTAGEVRECIADVDALVSSGQLYTPDTYEPLAGEYKERASGVIKALCLHVAHTCNLNCAYCFASQGKYHGERAVMSYEVGRQRARLPRRALRRAHQPRGRLLRRRAADELGRGQAPRGLRAEHRARLRQAFPLHAHDERRPAGRRGRRFLQPRDDKRRPLPRRAARGQRPLPRGRRGPRQLRAHRAELPALCEYARRQGILHARHVHALQHRLHARPLPHGRPRLRRA